MNTNEHLEWTVTFTKRVLKQVRELPAAVQDALRRLLLDIRDTGPVRMGRPNLGRILGKPGCHHCHIQKGRPTFVVVWRVSGEQSVEVLYVGTHEGANYGRIC